MDALVVALPERAERVFAGVARLGDNFRVNRLLMDQRHIAIRAGRESFTVLHAALGANQHAASLQRQSPGWQGRPETLDALYGEGDGVAAAEAEGGDAALEIAALQF